MLQSQQSWTPLETLAEVSRQINHLNEHGEDGGQSQHALSSAEPMSGVITSAVPNTSAGTDHFQMQEQFTLQSPQSSHKEQPQEKQGQSIGQSGYGGLSGCSFSIQDLMPLTAAMEHERRGSQEQAQGSQEATNNSADAPNMTVAAAAAATARLNSAAIMDAALFPSLGGNLGGNLGEELARAIGSVETGQQDGVAPIPATFAPTSEAGAPTAPARDHSPSRESQPPAQMTPSSSLIRIGAGEVSPLTPALDNRSPAPENHPPSSVATTPSRTTQLPWGEFTYMTNTATPPMPSSIKPMTGLPTKSVFRLEQNGNKSKHARARFEETRRKEVQQIRMIGACVRCRILRKTCSKGDPCDTCRKVLAPRLWRAGCIRIKFTDELDLYNAGVQIAHCQKMVNGYKATMNLNHTPVVLDATHSSSGVTIAVEALRGTKPNELIDPTVSEEYQTTVPQIIMIDDQEDLPEKMEAYVGAMLPEFIRKEEANFSRITLETALELHCRTDDEKAVLKMALELWGYVEVIERELKWDLSIRPSPIARVAAKSITRETDDDLYKTICLQLTAAAERRAMITSKELLKKMQQMLQHGRTAICHPMFFAILVLLITLEKSTWAFKSWEEVEALRECWPLENAPSYYTSQGFRMSEIFRMLLVIRKALPKIAVREGDGVLVLDDPDPIYGSYLERINLKGKQPPFLLFLWLF